MVPGAAGHGAFGGDRRAGMPGPTRRPPPSSGSRVTPARGSTRSRSRPTTPTPTPTPATPHGHGNGHEQRQPRQRPRQRARLRSRRGARRRGVEGQGPGAAGTVTATAWPRERARQGQAQSQGQGQGQGARQASPEGAPLAGQRHSVAASSRMRQCARSGRAQHTRLHNGTGASAGRPRPRPTPCARGWELITLGEVRRRSGRRGQERRPRCLAGALSSARRAPVLWLETRGPGLDESADDLAAESWLVAAQKISDFHGTSSSSPAGCSASPATTPRTPAGAPVGVTPQRGDPADDHRCGAGDGVRRRRVGAGGPSGAAGPRAGRRDLPRGARARHRGDGEALGISAVAVRVARHRGLKKLRANALTVARRAARVGRCGVGGRRTPARPVPVRAAGRRRRSPTR